MNKRSLVLLTPLIGICAYITLYIIAASVYPGGSNDDPTAKGFTLLHNYWCELLGGIAKNGEVNPSRPIAIAATISLSIGMGLFWFFLPHLFENRNKYQVIIQYAGILSMICIMLLFTSYHETAIITAGATGLLALILTFRELYRAKRVLLFRWGLVCLALIALNSFVYYTGNFFVILPVLQKITTLVALSWFACITICLYQKAQKQPLHHGNH